jgi:hypothetical protein
MGIHYDWNVEVIAQFYATLYVEEGGGARRMHWMTEGDWYHISYNDFASRFSFGAADAHHPRLHIHNPLEENEMKFMYAPWTRRKCVHKKWFIHLLLNPK